MLSLVDFYKLALFKYSTVPYSLVRNALAVDRQHHFRPETTRNFATALTTLEQETKPQERKNSVIAPRKRDLFCVQLVCGNVFSTPIRLFCSTVGGQL
jgi:hypothetical protein